MISHKYKCIFIHIPRTAGTNVENWIVGKDWWKLESSTKHLLASQTRELYKDYWDKYFKFSFVRNPWDRMVSCSTYSTYFGISHNKNLNFDKYKKLFGYPITLEHDYRFYKRDQLITKKHKENSIYLNILDEKLDFIGKFESLQKDIEFIKNTLDIKNDFEYQNKMVASNRKTNYRDYYNSETEKVVENLFAKDIKKFGYKF